MTNRNIILKAIQNVHKLPNNSPIQHYNYFVLPVWTRFSRLLTSLSMISWTVRLQSQTNKSRSHDINNLAINHKSGGGNDLVEDFAVVLVYLLRFDNTTTRSGIAIAVLLFLHVMEEGNRIVTKQLEKPARCLPHIRKNI